MSTQMDRIEHMLEALCEHLGVQGANRSRMQTASDVRAEARGISAAAANGRRYVGVVSRFEHGWGFVECAELDRNFFVHYSDIEGTGLRSLVADEEVSFELGPGKDGRPKAVRVRRQRTGQALPGQPQVETVSSRQTAGQDAGPTDAEDAGDEERDMLQPESSEVRRPQSSPRSTITRRARLGASSGRRPAISW